MNTLDVQSKTSNLKLEMHHVLCGLLHLLGCLVLRAAGDSTCRFCRCLPVWPGKIDAAKPPQRPVSVWGIRKGEQFSLRSCGAVGGLWLPWIMDVKGRSFPCC